MSISRGQINENKMKIITVNSWAELPGIPGPQLYRPDFREMTGEQAAKEARLETDYLPYGYSVAYFIQSMGVLFLFRSNS